MITSPVYGAIPMYDAIDAASLPEGGTRYAGYVNGRWPSRQAIARRFPGARVFGIDVAGDSWEQACILDYEPGNPCYSPAILKAWAVAREHFRQYTATVYCDRADLTVVEHTLEGTWHMIWLATLDGTDLTGTKTTAGTLIAGTQLSDMGGYDVSSVLASWT